MYIIIVDMLDTAFISSYLQLYLSSLVVRKLEFYIGLNVRRFPTCINMLYKQKNACRRSNGSVGGRLLYFLKTLVGATQLKLTSKFHMVW